DRHLPFGGEAVTRSGHPLPLATRTGYREADAILVASPHEPALDGVKADLHLSWHVARVHGTPTRDLIVAGPVGSWANDTAIARAFAGSHEPVAQGGRGGEGPGGFAAGGSGRVAVAGFGVVGPMGMLFTASVMLAEGLESRSASRTLERAVGAAARRTTRDTN